MIYHLAYNVPDVEHMGDLHWEEHMLRKMNASIVDTDVDWGGEEITSATIHLTCTDYNDFQQLKEYGCYEEVYNKV